MSLEAQLRVFARDPFLQRRAGIRAINVGPEDLRPTKAWEIHPINQLAER